MTNANVKPVKCDRNCGERPKTIFWIKWFVGCGCQRGPEKETEIAAIKAWNKMMEVKNE